MLPAAPQNRIRSLAGLTLLGALSSLQGLPIAVDDAFTLDEDFSASFEQGGSVLGIEWLYLDKLENENGLNHDYPL